jgi:hypothetical protein
VIFFSGGDGQERAGPSGTRERGYGKQEPKATKEEEERTDRRKKENEEKETGILQLRKQNYNWKNKMLRVSWVLKDRGSKLCP